MSSLADTLRTTYRRSALFRPARAAAGARRIRRWNAAGRPIPPPSDYKYAVVRQYAAQHSCDVLIETGTFYGGLVEVLRRHVRHVYSIELDDVLAARAGERFRRIRNVTILHGDSSAVLPSITSQIRGSRVLYWLDAHYSAGVTALGDLETPVEVELEHALPLPETAVVLIDDSREFGTNPAYPSLANIQKVASSRGFSFAVEDDVIRLVRDGVGAGG